MQSSSQAVRAKEDEPFLERFIEAHEGFILRTASRHAGHTVTRSDDEYSVALMAFYEAVKGYDPAGGRSAHMRRSSSAAGWRTTTAHRTGSMPRSALRRRPSTER